MGALRISLFGHVHVYSEDWSSEVKLTRTLQALFAYLLLERNRVHSRDVLADLFWDKSNQQQGRNSLNTALWRLRSAIQPKERCADSFLVTTRLGGVGFNHQSNYWLDIAEFEQQASRALLPTSAMLDTDKAVELERAVCLYTAELLESFYEDWALRHRERLRLIYLGCLARLMDHYHESGRYEESLDCGQRILLLDPLREDIHRNIIRLYLAMDQRALAARQYELCRAILSEELNIAPMVETQALYSQISDRSPPVSYPSYPYPGEGLQEAVHHFQVAIQSFEQAKEQLHKAIELLSHYSPTAR